MSVTDRERRHVFTMLEQAIGPEAADSMMQLLPFESSTELATRSDINATTTLLRGEMAELRADLTEQMAELRTELRTEMTELRTELRTEMAELRSELRTDLTGRMDRLEGEMIGLRAQIGAAQSELKGDFYRWGAVVVGANTVAMITALLT